MKNLNGRAFSHNQSKTLHWHYVEKLDMKTDSRFSAILLGFNLPKLAKLYCTRTFIKAVTKLIKCHTETGSPGRIL